MYHGSNDSGVILHFLPELRYSGAKRHSVTEAAIH